MPDEQGNIRFGIAGMGVGRSRANLEVAQTLAIIDRGATLADNWTAEIIDADLVLLSTPVAQYRANTSTTSAQSI